MPLRSGKKNFHYNVAELLKAGYPKNQALAIAYDKLRKRKRKKNGK